MSIESSLMRGLEIRFIDAKLMVTEAKLSLGISGYTSEDNIDQQERIIDEAIRIFHTKPEPEQVAMHVLHNRLNAIKSKGGSSCGSSVGTRTAPSLVSSMDNDEDYSSSDDVSCGSGKSLFSKKFNLLRRRR